jgi:hypothetical protein
VLEIGRRRNGVRSERKRMQSLDHFDDLDVIPRWNAATLSRIIAKPGQLEQSR